MRAGLPALACAGLLAACTTVPVGTLAALSAFDPAKADPAALRAAVRIPEGFRLGKDGAILVLTAWRKDYGKLVARVRLEAAATEAGRSGADDLAPWRKPGFTVTAYRIAAEDLPHVATFRTTAAERRLDNLRFGIDAALCRAVGAIGPALATSLLKTGPGARWLPLNPEIDLEALELEGGEKLRIPPC
jgi:hypothetical protein